MKAGHLVLLLLCESLAMLTLSIIDLRAYLMDEPIHPLSAYGSLAAVILFACVIASALGALLQINKEVKSN